MVDGLPPLPDPDWDDHTLLAHLYTYVSGLDMKVDTITIGLTNHLQEHMQINKEQRMSKWWWASYVALLAAGMTLAAKGIELFFL